MEGLVCSTPEDKGDSGHASRRWYCIRLKHNLEARE